MISAAGSAARARRSEMPDVPLEKSTSMRPCIIENRQIHVEDFAALPTATEAAALRLTTALGPLGTAAFTPLSQDGRAIGAMAVARSDVRPFQEAELELMRGFADQAAIAIENARLLAELRESLDRQTATADILRVIASTPGDAANALDTIAETAVRLFDASSVGFRRLDGDMLRSVASAGPEARNIQDIAPAYPRSAVPYVSECLQENRQISLPDIDATPNRPPLGNVRSSAVTPLSQDEKTIGVMFVNRSEVRAFEPDELELMRGFADQAVIAIENARLLS